ncbi:MAG TPA: hypothetical protein ENN12_01115 [Epsilonproteobacteria bacterium]|nr:hypothetical protein [Campylobacterota bacterium]
MLETNIEKISQVREKTIEILEDLTISQKLALHALEACDEKSFLQIKIPLKKINEQVEDVDNLIVTILARYAPEASDLREVVAFLKITYSLQRIATNEKNYMKNMSICNAQTDPEAKRIIQESLAINRCTIRALESIIEMIQTTNDHSALEDLERKINLENSKTDDIYSVIEKEALQVMHKESNINDISWDLLKYIRKNLKIMERLEDIASKLIFARIGGKL